MGFQSLASLAFGLTLPLIVLMYILKRRYIDTPVPSHLLWDRVLRNLEANAPWQRLRSHLLLILQLLAAALLVLALMEPFIWQTGQPKGHLVLVVDRSASMDTKMAGTGAADAPVTRLEEAKRQALDLVTGEAAGSAVTLLAMGGQPEVLTTREAQREAVESALQSIEPYYGRSAYKETMSLAAALTKGDPDAEIRVLTDSQWTEAPSGLTFDVGVGLMDIGGGQEAGNLSVMQFGVKAAGGGTKGVTAAASVRNMGSSEREAELTLYAGPTPKETRKVRLGPGESGSLSWEGLPEADYYKLSLDGGDAFDADNQSYAFLSTDRPKRVLLLTSGNLFLEKALGTAGAEVIKASAGGTGREAEGTTGGSGPPQGEFDLIVLDGTPADSLQGEAWSKLLQSRPVWFIHAGLQGADAPVPQAEYKLAEHAVTKYLRFSDIHIARALQAASAPWEQPLVTAEGGTVLIGAGLEQGQPRLWFTFDLHQSDLPLRPEFPILVRNAVDWLGSRQHVSLGRAAAGEQRDIPVPAGAVSAEWRRVDGMTSASAAPLPAELMGGGVSARQTVPGEPGLYSFAAKESDGTEHLSYLEVIADPAERSVDERRDLAFARAGTAEEQADGTGAPGGDSGRTPLPLLPWLAALVLILVMVEWGVYRRGHRIS